MFNVPFLPRAIRVCKVYVSFHHCADDFVFGELCPIVSSYNPNLLSIRKEHPFYILCPFVCVRSQNRIAGRCLEVEFQQFLFAFLALFLFLDFLLFFVQMVGMGVPFTESVGVGIAPMTIPVEQQGFE